MSHRLTVAIGLVAGLAAGTLPALADPHTHHGGHDHSQHQHAQVLKLGQRWEAGVDVVDWKKPTKACSLHAFIVSNNLGGNCPITASAKFDKPTTAPRNASHRLGIVLLPSKAPKTPITTAAVTVNWGNAKPLKLQHSAGYYWTDLPAGAKGPLTLSVSQGNSREKAVIQTL